MIKHIVLLFCLIALWACASVEDSDFFQPRKTSDYLLEAYQGNTDFTPGNQYDIDINLINRISFTSFDGKSEAAIQGIYLGDLNAISSRKIIVYCHDKSENIDYYWPRIKLLGNLGLDEFGILAFDYRGFGRSTGSSSEESIYADTDAALRWLQDQGVTEENILFYGYGLGAAAAIELSASPRSLRAQKIILEAPFASIESLIQNELLQNVPASYLTDLSFNNVDKIRKVSQPLLWLHGRQDKVYDISDQGQLVFNAHPGTIDDSKFFTKVDNANHYDLPEKFENSYAGYLLKLLSFVQSK